MNTKVSHSPYKAVRPDDASSAVSAQMDIRAIEVGQHPSRELEITIDTIPYRIDYTVATASQLLWLAGQDPANYYLVQVVGKKERISYKDKPKERIELHEGSKFVTVYDGGVPFS